MPLRLIALGLLAAAAYASPVAAQPAQDAASASAPGQIDFTYNRSRPTAAPADQTPLQARGVKLRDLVLATPALRDPRGFALHASVVLERPVASRAGDPDTLRGSVISRRINVSRAKPDAAGRYPGDGEGPVLLLSINRLEDALGHRSDAGFFTLPNTVREQGGALRVTRSGRDYVVVAPAGISPYQPVTIGEYADAVIKQYDGNGSPELAAKMRAALAALNPTTRTAPYCMTSALEWEDLAGRCRTPGAQAIVRFNPRLEPGAGRATRARIMTLSAPPLGRTGDAQERQRLLQAMAQIDLNAVRALLS
jgi:hypothetical protein